MSPIEQQLRAVGRRLDSASPPITADEILARYDTNPQEATTMTLTIAEPEAPEQGGPAPRATRVWLLAAAAAIVLIVGLVVIGTRSDEEVPADTPQPTVPAPIPDEDAAEPESAAAPAQLPFPGQDIAAGRYTTRFTGVEVDFDLPEDSTLVIGSENRVLFVDAPDPLASAGSRDMGLLRIGSWNTSAEGVDPTLLEQGSIDPYDIDGWAAEADIEVTSRSTITVGAREVEAVDVQLADGAEVTDYVSCGAAAGCRFAASVSDGSQRRTDRNRDIALGVREVNRFWLVPIEGSDPLIIWANTAADDVEWLDLVESTTIANLVVGPDAPPLGQS